MKWLNTLRRWCGVPEHPPATTGEQSVLFVLEKHTAAMTFEELREATKIISDDLRQVLDSLQYHGRVVRSAQGRYRSVHKKKGN
jgi:predicted transcriptional regulator of viral defense system